LYNFSTVQLSTKGSESIIARRKNQGVTIGNKVIYEFVFIPNSGFLNSNLPLMTNCELKLSFDRVNADVALVEYDSVTEDQSGQPLTIKDCVAITEYIASDKLEKHFMKVDHNPIHITTKNVISFSRTFL